MLSINGIFICVSCIVDEFIKDLIHKMEGEFFFPVPFIQLPDCT